MARGWESKSVDDQIAAAEAASADRPARELTPDERELWIADGHNKMLHVFDNTVMPPKQIASLPVRDQPGWITFSIDGRFVYPSTGEVFDAKTRKVIATFTDEVGRRVGSEKLVEIVTDGGKPIRAGDQFGIGGRKA